MDPNVSIPETWAEHSNRNIQESQSSTNFVILNSLMSVPCGQTKASREFRITCCSKIKLDYLNTKQKKAFINEVKSSRDIWQKNAIEGVFFSVVNNSIKYCATSET
jgi:hypothetical protein